MLGCPATACVLEDDLAILIFPPLPPELQVYHLGLCSAETDPKTLCILYQVISQTIFEKYKLDWNWSLVKH